jgi:DNA-binding transcriptional regulator YbjK
MNAAVTEREELDDFIKSAVVSLTEQELDLLQTHSLSELDDELARAEAAYLSANDHNRQESEDRYRMLIGLAAKIADRPVDQPTQAEVERADEYMRQREMLEAEFSHLPTVERENRIAEFKDEFFAEPAGHSEEEQHE